MSKKTSTHLNPTSKENVQEMFRHDSPTPTEIARESLEFGRQLGVCIARDETPVIRKITRSTGKELERQ